jgi:hypothetical protein
MNDQTLVSTGRWAPAQKRSHPSALDIRTEAPRTPRFDRFTDGLADTPDEDAVVSAVGDEWKAAQRSMLRIGRYLVRAKRTFARTFINDIVSRLPFEYRTANMLMEVARGVDDGLLPEEALPSSYRAAYRLITLPSSDLAEAKRRNLARPETTQQQVEQFRRELRSSSLTRYARLIARRQELLSEIERMRTREVRIQEELVEIALEIGGDGGEVIEAEATERESDMDAPVSALDARRARRKRN